MGKIRAKQGSKRPPGKGVADNALGKISADIGAISLGPPRAKILKKTGQGHHHGTSSSSSANFASRIHSQNKGKKKVTFCQNLVEEELKEKSLEGEDAKQYFKVLHPSAIRKYKRGGMGAASIKLSLASRISAMVPEKADLLSKSMPELRRTIGNNLKNKKMRLKVKKETFKKKMELLKSEQKEVLMAKQRQQTVIVGDMNPILESLPSIEEMSAEGGGEAGSKTNQAELQEEKSIPKKTKFSVKKTQKALLDSLKFFEAAGVGKTAAGLSAN